MSDFKEGGGGGSECTAVAWNRNATRSYKAWKKMIIQGEKSLGRLRNSKKKGRKLESLSNGRSKID